LTVTGFQIMYEIVEPGLPCWRCINCKTGRPNICLGTYFSEVLEIADSDSDIRYCGAPGSAGSLSRYFALPADMAPHLPEHISWVESGSVQPLAVSPAKITPASADLLDWYCDWETCRPASTSNCSNLVSRLNSTMYTYVYMTTVDVDRSA
jgi:hypothetical protein